jgi:hypothetical protein
VDELADLPPDALRLIRKALRAAFQRGRRSAELSFDKLLQRHTQVKGLNGTTGLFLEDWGETVQKRKDASGHEHGNDGKFTGGGKQSGNTPLTREGNAGQGVAAGGHADNAARAQHSFAPIPEEHLLDGLHAEVPAGLWEHAVGKVKRAASKVHEKLVLATPAFLKLQGLFEQLENLDDLRTLGYQPVLSGVAGHGTPDALREATGVGGTLGARLAAHVLARVVSWMRKGLTAEQAVGKALEEVFGKAGWDESKHKRDHGKFSSTGGADDGFGDVRPASATGEGIPLSDHFPTGRTPAAVRHGPEVLDPLFEAAERAGHVHRVKLADITNPGDANGVPHQDSVDAGVVADYRGKSGGRPVRLLYAPDGTLSLWDGRHRAVAAKLRGDAAVDAVIVEEGKGGVPRFVRAAVGKAFDPSEKRDEAGKWTAGGGGAAPVDKTGEPVNMADVVPDVVDDPENYEAWRDEFDDPAEWKKFEDAVAAARAARGGSRVGSGGRRVLKIDVPDPDGEDAFDVKVIKNPTPEEIRSKVSFLRPRQVIRGLVDGDDLYVWWEDDVHHQPVAGQLGIRKLTRFEDRVMMTRDADTGDIVVDTHSPNPAVAAWARKNGLVPGGEASGTTKSFLKSLWSG